MRAAVVLCGGFSRRMGREKCTLKLGDSTLLGHVLRAAHESVEKVVVVGRAGQDPQALIPEEFRSNTEFVWDRRMDSGPLEGVRSGIASLADSFHAVFACGGDFPLVKPAFIELLFRLADDFDAAVPWIDGRMLPLPAVYQTTVLPRLEARLESGDRHFWHFVEQLNARRVSLEEIEAVDAGAQSLINVNDPETLETAISIWRQRPHQTVS